MRAAASLNELFATKMIRAYITARRPHKAINVFAVWAICKDNLCMLELKCVALLHHMRAESDQTQRARSLAEIERAESAREGVRLFHAKT